MKRSKIFLAGTTCLLAIAGIAATKTHRSATNPGWFKNHNHSGCTQQSQAVGVTTNVKGSSPIVLTTTPTGTSTHYQVFSQPFTGGACAGFKMYKNPEL